MKMFFKSLERSMQVKMHGSSPHGGGVPYSPRQPMHFPCWDKQIHLSVPFPREIEPGSNESELNLRHTRPFGV